MEEKVIELITKELGVSKNDISLCTEIGGIPEWDSLHNVQIFGLIEQTYNLKILPEQIMDLETVQDIVDFLRANGKCV